MSIYGFLSGFGVISKMGPHPGDPKKKKNHPCQAAAAKEPRVDTSEFAQWLQSRKDEATVCDGRPPRGGVGSEIWQAVS